MADRSTIKISKLDAELRNNCIYPISVALMPSSNRNTDRVIVYEVRTVSTIGVPPPPFGASVEDGPEIAQDAILPQDFVRGLDTGSQIDVPAGDDVTFSVPIEHVSPRRYIRVEFELRVPVGVGQQPGTYVEFGWGGLPEEARAFSRARALEMRSK